MIYALVALSLSVIGLIAYLVHSSISDAHKQGDARVAQTAMEGHLEREQYEHAVTKKALAAAKARAMSLEKAFGHVLAEPHPDGSLPANDVHGRVLRIQQEWREADDARDSVPAEPDGAVPDHPAAAKAGTPAGVLADPFTEPVP